MNRLTLSTPLAGLDWITPRRMKQLEQFGLRTVEDLVTHFPRRHEDRRKFDRFPQQESDTAVCVCGVVAKISIKRLPSWKKMVEVVLQEEAHALSTTLVCRWFNAHFVEKIIATGQQLVVFGKPKLRSKKICIDHPEFEIVENDDDLSIHLKRITPVHPATEGLSARQLRALIFRGLEQLDPEQLPRRLPVELDDYGFAEALRQIHFPSNWGELERARRHLVLHEFFAMQLFIAAKRAETVSHPGEAHCGSGQLLERFLTALPFPLTKAQTRAVAEIRTDLESIRPMNRLLHGDVGSGKTVVALSVMLLAVEAGFQAALMVPTQILAEQHYLNFKRWLAPLGIRIALRTGDRREETALPLVDAGSGMNTLGSAGCQPAVSGSLPETSIPTAEGALYSKRRLPHFERPWAKYMVTFSTRGKRILSIKSRDAVMESILRWQSVRYELFAACVMPDHVHLLIEPMIEKKDETDASLFFPLSKILHSIKSFTAKEINTIESTSGIVWESESFDRIIRSENDLQEKFEYITRNPWDTGILLPDESYPWVWLPGLIRAQSSACTQQSSACTPKNFEAGCLEEQAGSLRSPMRSPMRSTKITPENNTPQILIGTHALLYDGVEFSNPGLIVIDEQHKFGVMQRAQLISKGTLPDVLVMTATPIPRTLAMTVYGDLDVSILDEMPANRSQIITALRDPSKLPDAIQFLKKHLESGRQAYIVYPLIDESEKLAAKAATLEFKKWQEALSPMSCELLHGRIDSVEKARIMERFRSGEVKALITTTVIEVGIDVPNANIMLIENAERFGLAQIHQLRGRIGRGLHKSYCILLSAGEAIGSVEKLRILEKTSNGFEIAEADLQLRGAGDILGTAQSGLPPLKLGNLLEDTELMRLARQSVLEIFKEDPFLELDENKCFRELVIVRRKLTFSQVS